MATTTKAAAQAKDEQVDPNAGRTKCKVYSRVCGFIRPVDNWNDSKANEFCQRQTFSEKISEKSSCDLPL